MKNLKERNVSVFPLSYKSYKISANDTVKSNAFKSIEYKF